MVCTAFAFSLVQPARAQDDKPVDLKVLMATLKQIKDKRALSEKAMEVKAVEDFRAAASSNAAAIAFYQGVAAATGGDGKNRRPEWAKSEAAGNAARLHLNYLLLTIQRAAGATTKQLEPALMAHIVGLNAAGAGDAAILVRREESAKGGYMPSGRKRVPDHEPTFSEQDLMKQDVSSSIFVKWYGIQRMLEGAKDWETNFGDVDGIYQKTLLPYYRQKRDPLAVAYWETKIQQEAQRATSSNEAVKIDKFNAVRRPQLLWKRAGEMVSIGQRNRGMNEMLNWVRTFPDHPDLADWISSMEGMIAENTPPAIAQPAPQPVAQPVAQPTPELVNLFSN